MQTTRQTLVTLCCSVLEGTQVLGCKNAMLYSVDWVVVWFSTVAAFLIVGMLFQFCPFLFLFALSTYLYMVTAETTFVIEDRPSSQQIGILGKSCNVIVSVLFNSLDKGSKMEQIKISRINV